MVLMTNTFPQHKQPLFRFWVPLMGECFVVNLRHFHDCGLFYKRALYIFLSTFMHIPLALLFIVSLPYFIFLHLCVTFILSVTAVVSFKNCCYHPFATQVRTTESLTWISLSHCLTTSRTCGIYFLVLICILFLC